MDRFKQLDFFERIFVKKCLQDRKFITAVSPYITEDIFGENNNFVVCNGIKNFFEKYGTIPNVSELITSTNNNSEAIKYVIKTCKDIETDFNDEYLFEEAEKFLKERMIMAALKRE